jgi:hypothetical protein
MIGVVVAIILEAPYRALVIWARRLDVRAVRLAC